MLNNKNKNKIFIPVNLMSNQIIKVLNLKIICFSFSNSKTFLYQKRTIVNKIIFSSHLTKGLLKLLHQNNQIFMIHRT